MHMTIATKIIAGAKTSKTKRNFWTAVRKSGYIKVINFLSSAFISNPVNKLEIEDTTRSTFYQTTTYSGDAFDERSMKIEVPPHQGSRSAMGQFKVVMHAASSGHWKKENLKVNWILLFPKTTV